MATDKNITMRQFNGSDYDTLYPRTTPSQVSGLYDSVYTKDQVNSLFNQCLLTDGSRAMNGNLNMNGHYIPNLLTGASGADAARKDYVDNLISSCAKIQTGSYVGTGTYGEANPVTLTFGFVPKLFMLSATYLGSSSGDGSIKANSVYYVTWFVSGNWFTSARGTSIYFNVNGNTLVYYGGSSADMSNENGYSYRYVCLG